MFKFLKEKLKGAISKLTEKAKEESEEQAEERVEEKESEIEKLEEERKAIEKEEKELDREIKKAKEGKKEEIREKKKKEAKKPAKEKKKTREEPEKGKKPPGKKAGEKKEEKKKEEKKEGPEKEPLHEKKVEELEKKREEAKEEEKEIIAEEKEAKKEKAGLFSKLREKITKTRISSESFEKLFWELEVVLLENNVAVEVIEKIKGDLRKSIVENPVPRGKIQETIIRSLKDSIRGVISAEKIDLLGNIRKKPEKPYVICFVGVNGSGKTTTIAKVAQYLMDNNISCVLAASDTFRAAAIDQLQAHADNLGIKLVKHDYGADAAAVAFDAVSHAKAKSVDAVLIDTAGRMHSNANLMDEMKKIVRVAKPDLKVFVGESIVGNDCIEQAERFDSAVGIDAIILSKADVDEKGGTAISISKVTKKPIIFIGTGQEYRDLRKFQPEIVLESLGL